MLQQLPARAVCAPTFWRKVSICSGASPSLHPAKVDIGRGDILRETFQLFAAVRELYHDLSALRVDLDLAGAIKMGNDVDRPDWFSQRLQLLLRICTARHTQGRRRVAAAFAHGKVVIAKNERDVDALGWWFVLTLQRRTRTRRLLNDMRQLMGK